MELDNVCCCEHDLFSVLLWEKYLKLRNLEFGYNFPKSIVEKATLSGLRLYLSGQNLAGLSNLIGVDPEIQETNGLAYPTTRIVNIGLTVKF